jgi:hypothetical protein
VVTLLAGALGVLALVATTSGAAADFRLSGSVGPELRWFPESPQFAGQFEHFQSSVLFEPEARWGLENGDQVTVVPFLRLDAQDDERTHSDLREAFWRRVGEQWDILIGVNRVFWGVTESRHLVDVINQVDSVEEIDEEDRLGQPMINLSTQREWGNLDLFVLPGFRERTFAGSDGRPRFALSVDSDNAEYESGAGDRHIDYALRYTHVLGDWDIGAHLFYGTGREPSVTESSNGTRLIPNYNIITQAGTDLQYTREAWLWKFEGLLREGQGDAFGALVAGFEYTFFQINDSAADLGVLFEYLYDGRDEDFTTTPPTIFDDDVFVGSRFVLNDVQDTSILAGATIDVENHSTLLIIEAERRLGDSWSLEAKGRFFIDVDDDRVLQNFEDDSFINISLSWHY